MVSKRKAKKAAAHVKNHWRRIFPPKNIQPINGFVVPCQELVTSDLERLSQEPSDTSPPVAQLEEHTGRTNPLVSQLRKIGPVSVLLGGLSLTQPQFFWLSVGLVNAGTVLWFVDLLLERIRSAWKVGIGIVMVAGLVVFNRMEFASAPLNLTTVGSRIDYSGAGIAAPGKIAWRPLFTELDLMMTNPSAGDYDNVDVLVRPDLPIAAIAQLTDLPGVSFQDKYGVIDRVSLKEVNSATPASAMTLLGTNAGYTVHCSHIPPNTTLTVVMAIVEFKPSAPPGSPIVLQNPNAVSTDDFSMVQTMSGKDGVFYYWFGSPRNTLLYLPPPKPRKILVSGYYTANNHRRGITTDVSVWWRADE